MTPHQLENRCTQFCALAYDRQQGETVLSLKSVILILLHCPNKGLEILARPDWERIVEPIYLGFMEELLADFKERSLEHPENLMKQASSLSVGPLVTYAAGARLAEHEELLLLSRKFQKV